MKKLKLHLGCGKDHRKGYLNCDMSRAVNPDKIVDLEKKLPFGDNSVEEIIINHTLEHIRSLIPLMEEIYRVCSNGAKVKIRVPYFAYPGAFQDPTHVRFFTLKTFNYFDPKDQFSYYSSAKFITREKRLRFFATRPSKLIDFFTNMFPRFYERFLSRLLPAEELIVTLEVVK